MPIPKPVPNVAGSAAPKAAAKGGTTPSKPTELDTRTRILAAALELFAERGFASATTSEIARLAGVAEKTLFAHFKTKDALFDATLTPATIDLLIPEVLTPVSPVAERPPAKLEDFLEKLLQNRLQIIRKHPSKFKLIVQELLLRPERARQLVLERDDRITPVLTSVLRDMRARGELRELSVPLVLRMYAYVLLGYAVQTVLFTPGEPADERGDIARMVNILVDGLKPRSLTPAAPDHRARPKAPAAKRVKAAKR